MSSLLVGNVRRAEGVLFGEDGDIFSLRLARLPVVLGLLRQQLGTWLKRRGVSADEVVDITLACSEGCANAIEHPLAVGHQAVEVEASLRANEVQVAIRDFGTWAVESGADGQTRGRGLELIRQLMDDVTVNAFKGGTQLTMRRRLNSRAAA
jgi:anti-sigma regulatory factor (Ser/Thr protein kinase)